MSNCLCLECGARFEDLPETMPEIESLGHTFIPFGAGPYKQFRCANCTNLAQESVITPEQLERLKDGCKALPSPVVPTLAELPLSPYNPRDWFWGMK